VNYDEAEARYRQSLAIKVRLGDQAGMATSYHQLGMLAMVRGDYEEAGGPLPLRVPHLTGHLE
jgi:Flp pilus assembly protein TadD